MPRKKYRGPKTKAYPKTKGPPPQHIRHEFIPTGHRDGPSFAGSHGYTLAEEARNTASNRRGNRGFDARLRYQPVTFVSAGFMDPLEDFEIPKTVSPMQSEPIESSPKTSRKSSSKAIGLPDSSTQPKDIDVTQIVQQESTQSEDGHRDNESEPDSDSSEEVILFKGRNAFHGQQKSSLRKAAEDRTDRQYSTVPLGFGSESQLKKEAMDMVRKPDHAPKAEDLEFIPFNMTHGKRSSSGKRRSNINSLESDEEAAIIADYIANMKDDIDNDDEDEDDIEHPGFGAHPFSILRDLGGTDSDAIPSQPSSGDESGDESDDEIEEADDVRAGKRQQESEDEHLAQLIVKQEDLDLGNDDVSLFDDTDLADGWLPATGVRRRKKGVSKTSRIFQGGSQFPSATKMAQAFDELDLMDMQNSRLQRSKKGPISFGLLDSELEDALNISIKKDRLKKAGKKKAREELRSQGLLGKNANPPDLRVKYQGGMSLDDLADEVEAFVLSNREQLVLPPVDKGARKIVHTVANTFKIKSKSAGTGVGRYPVLYRSKATLPYDEALFEKAFSRVARTWFPRVDVDEKVVRQARVLKRTEVRTGKSRVGKSSLILREGDIVGQHASEIGVENKGRAMLEKMGWTKGMSLGTVESKGITVPLTHVIKKTKAGLGDI